MATPEFVLELRRHVGQRPLWLPGTTAVVFRGAEVLLVQRSDNGAWTPVTGIVEPGEHPALTAVREVREETGVTSEVEALSGVDVSAPTVHANGDHAQYLNHTFRCRWISGEPYPADEESSAAGWFRLDDLPPMRADFIDRVRVAAAGNPTTRLVY